MVPAPGAEAAAQTLKNTPFDAQIQSLEGKIDSLWKDTADGTGKLYKDLSEGIRALNEVNAALPALAQSIAVEADNIVLAADTEAIQATVAARTQEAKANAEATNELLKDFVPVTTQQAEALAVIKQKTSDLKIEADEAPLVATNLQLIRNSLKAGQDLSIKNTDEIIVTLNTYLLKLNEQSKQIQGLNERVQRIPVR
jgi:DNA repair exonuclease SbcCD ATPase subunit